MCNIVDLADRKEAQGETDRVRDRETHRQAGRELKCVCNIVNVADRQREAHKA